MLKVLIRFDQGAILDKGYKLTQYLDSVGCPWTIGDGEGDILIEWSDFYDYLSEDLTFKKNFFYDEQIHVLESNGRVARVGEIFPIRNPATFDLNYNIGEGSAVYNRNMSVLYLNGNTIHLNSPKEVLEASKYNEGVIRLLYERGLFSPTVEKEIKESKLYT